MFYAKFSPRGFANEYEILAFTTRALRDQFCAAVPRTVYSAYYGAMVYTDNQSARAEAISAREAATETYAERQSGYNCCGEWTRNPYAFGRCEPLTLAEYFARGWYCGKTIDALDERGHRIEAGTAEVLG